MKNIILKNKEDIDYINNTPNENNINERKSFYSNEEEIKEAYAIIETLEEYHIYGELNELSQLMYDYLIWAIDCLKNIKNKNNENQKALNLAINLLKSMATT